MSVRDVWPLLAVLAVAGACGSHPHFEKHHLGRLPHTSTREAYYTVSADGTHLAFIQTTRTGQRVVENGVAGPEFTAVARIAYAAETTQLYYFGMHDREGGRRLYLVVGGRVHPVDFVHEPQLAFSRDGTRWALVDREADAADGSRGNVVVVDDGGVTQRWPDATIPAFSPDGRHVAHLVEDAEARVSLVVDGRVRRTYGMPEGKCSPLLKPTVRAPTLSPQFSARFLADGSVLVVTRDTGCWSVFRDDARLASYPNLLPGRTLDMVIVSSDFAPEPAMLADPIATAAAAPAAFWWEKLPGVPDRWRLVRDGVPIDDRTCSRPGEEPAAMSADGTHALYPCFQPATDPSSRLDDLYVVYDGRADGPYKFLFALTLSADGRRSAYAAASSVDDPWRFRLDGMSVGRGYDNAFPPVFSPAGGHVGWTGSHRKRAHLVFDVHEIATVDEVLRAPRIGDDGTITVVVRRKRRVTRLRFSP